MKLASSRLRLPFPVPSLLLCGALSAVFLSVLATSAEAAAVAEKLAQWSSCTNLQKSTLRLRAPGIQAFTVRSSSVVGNPVPSRTLCDSDVAGGVIFSDPGVTVVYENSETKVVCHRLEVVPAECMPMLVRAPSGSCYAHFVQVFRRQPGLTNWFHAMSLFGDGSVDLAPFVRPAQTNHSAGGQLLLGPVLASDWVWISDLSFDPSRSEFKVTYVASGGLYYWGSATAVYRLSQASPSGVECRVETLLTRPGAGFAAFRSATSLDAGGAADAVAYRTAAGAVVSNLPVPEFTAAAVTELTFAPSGTTTGAVAQYRISDFLITNAPSQSTPSEESEWSMVTSLPSGSWKFVRYSGLYLAINTTWNKPELWVAQAGSNPLFHKIEIDFSPLTGGFYQGYACTIHDIALRPTLAGTECLLATSGGIWRLAVQSSTSVALEVVFPWDWDPCVWFGTPQPDGLIAYWINSFGSLSGLNSLTAGGEHKFYGRTNYLDGYFVCSSLLGHQLISSNPPPLLLQTGISLDGGKTVTISYQGPLGTLERMYSAVPIGVGGSSYAVAGFEGLFVGRADDVLRASGCPSDFVQSLFYDKLTGQLIASDAQNTYLTMLPPACSINRALNGQVEVDWCGGLLQTAPTPQGPWTDVTDSPAPRLFNSTGLAKFFRVVRR